MLTLGVKYLFIKMYGGEEMQLQGFLMSELHLRLSRFPSKQKPPVQFD
jgi:hypothetical protein